MQWMSDVVRPWTGQIYCKDESIPGVAKEGQPTAEEIEAQRNGAKALSCGAHLRKEQSA